MSRKKLTNLLALLVVFVLVGGRALTVSADTQSDLNEAIQQRDETAKELNTVQDRIAVLETKKGEALAYLSELNAQLNDLNEELADLQYQYKEKQLQLDVVNQELGDASLEEERQREDMGVRIQYMYENASDAGILEAIFSARSFTDFLNRAENFSSLTEYDRKMLEEYREIYLTVKEKKFEVVAEKKAVALLAAKNEDKLNEIKELYDLTSGDIKVYSDELTEEQGEQSAILSELQEREAEIGRLTMKISEEIAAAEARAREEAERAAAAAAAAAAAQQAQAAAAPVADAPAANNDTGASEVSTSGNVNETPQSYDTGGWSGTVLTRTNGVVMGPSGKETYYNLDMSGVVQIMRNMGNTDPYWVRSDGCKMLGDYIMCAANLSVHPRGSLVQSSLGMCRVCDTGGFAFANPNQLDIATNW